MGCRRWNRRQHLVLELLSVWGDKFTVGLSVAVVGSCQKGFWGCWWGTAHLPSAACAPILSLPQTSWRLPLRCQVFWEQQRLLVPRPPCHQGCQLPLRRLYQGDYAGSPPVQTVPPDRIRENVGMWSMRPLVTSLHHWTSLLYVAPYCVTARTDQIL